MNPICVMIVEDDFMVADLNRQFTESSDGFIVTKVAHNGAEALDFLAQNIIDLIILDIYLPDIRGIELLKIIRKNDYPSDIILITAAHDADTVKESIRFGVFDYIIKPFDVTRYKNSLSSYIRRRKSLESAGIIDQERVDTVMTGATTKSISPDTLPKGISLTTMERVKMALEPMNGEIGIDDICSSIPVSRITAHRYLEYLAEEGFLEKNYRYQHIGRPLTVYARKRSGNSIRA